MKPEPIQTYHDNPEDPLFGEPYPPYVPETHTFEAEPGEPEGEFINCKWCGKPEGLH